MGLFWRKSKDGEFDVGLDVYYPPKARSTDVYMAVHKGDKATAFLGQWYPKRSDHLPKNDWIILRGYGLSHHIKPSSVCTEKPYPCEILSGGECICDGSTLAGLVFVDGFQESQSETLVDWLEEKLIEEWKRRFK